MRGYSQIEGGVFSQLASAMTLPKFFVALNKLCRLIIMFFTCGVSEGQNLVPNGDFEQYSGCPNSYGQIDSALFWINPTVGSPDYYNACAGNPVSVPTNAVGYQVAHSGGAYAGIILRHATSASTREYIETPFITPLIANVHYYFEMYVNTSDNCQYTTDAIQAYFSDTLVIGFSPATMIPFSPQISNAAGNYFDKQNWKKVSGTYIAHGGENYLIIGNFKPDSSTTILNNGGFGPAAYVLIDDVCVSVHSTNCNSTSGIDSVMKDDGVNLFPNPFTDKINIAARRNDLIEVNLFDITARKLFNQSFTNSITINTEQLAKGIYLYELRNKNGVIKKGKVVKN
ncbi:MAG: T9SS type A sorting domain-containing protein [Bacteroidia bacterium]|nr:T9SS type A sorting domain-containing protein [Bacteroidia bacterium]